MCPLNISFKQALDKASAYKKRHLLLGNGFSIACAPKIFNYASLFEAAKPSMTPELLDVFGAMGTTDFEAVIRALQNAASIADIYRGKKTKTSSAIAEDAKRLKQALVKAVAGKHPERPFDIADNRYLSCRNWLNHFIGNENDGRIYTLNYDLLLYWALMQSETEIGGPTLSHNDGFGKDPKNEGAEYVVWHGETKSNSQNVFYMHGAMHLYDAGADLKKFTWINSGEALVDQANAAMASDLFPVFVAEGESPQKLTKIRHSAYLHHCYKSFVGVCNAGKSNCLFIFGHSLDKNDDHILERIGQGQIAHLFISLYGDPKAKENKNIQRRAQGLQSFRKDAKQPLKVDFFDAESANVWG